VFVCVEKSKDYKYETFVFYKGGSEFGFKSYSAKEKKQLDVKGMQDDLRLYFSANYYAHANPPPEGFEFVDDEADDEEEEEEEEDGEEEVAEDEVENAAKVEPPQPTTNGNNVSAVGNELKPLNNDLTSKPGDDNTTKEKLKRDESLPLKETKSDNIVDNVEHEGQDDDDDDDDEDFNPEEEEEEDNDDDYVTDEEDQEDVPTEQLETLYPAHKASKPFGVIEKDDLTDFWRNCYQSLSGNTLYFTTFRNSCSALVKELLFKNNPVMKKLGELNDAVVPSFQELIEIVKEPTKIYDTKEKTNQNTVIVNPSTSIEDLSILKTFLNLKFKKFETIKKAKEGYHCCWIDDLDYDFDENDDSLENEKTEWKIFGCDISRFIIGSWTVGRAYRGQFRLKIDPINKELLMTMFQFELPSIMDCLHQIKNKEDCLVFLEEQKKKFKSSKGYQMKIPLENVKGLHYHESLEDPTLALLVLDLAIPPKFLMKEHLIWTDTVEEKQNNVKEDAWKSIGDYSENGQASCASRYFLCGLHSELKYVKGILTMLSSDLSEAYLKPSMVSIQAPQWFDEKVQERQLANNNPFKSNKEEIAESCLIQ